ncbi:hypothetical protein V6Z11_A05G356400 [Gossypium hirsutum]
MKSVGLYDSSEKGMIVTFFCITGLLVTRWIYSGHFPLSDLYESLIFLSLGAITAPSAIFTQGFATSGLLTKMHQSAILATCSPIPSGYAALLCGSLLSVALLVITFRKAIKIIGENNNFSFSWSYRIISLGFIFLTIGILSGAVWANEAWGSYWNWDPKETWAFITWTVFAIYFHTRTNTNLEGVNSALVASMGFLIIWICYFGVNLLGIGLHSYGSFTVN